MYWIFFFIIGLFSALPAAAADLGTPKLSDAVAKHDLLDADRYLLSLDVKYQLVPGYTLEPQLGVGYAAREREAGVGLDESLYKIHAHAGGKIDLAKKYFLSAAAKVPVYTYGLTEVRSGLFSAQDSISRHGNDFSHLFSYNLLWTGEMGVHLGLGADLTIYYDQNAFDLYQPGAHKQKSASAPASSSGSNDLSKRPSW